MSALRPNHREKALPKNLNGLIDPTKTGKYPVILSDTLLGRTQKEVFTSVRYNHKPELASEPATARLKPETPGSKSSFDLSFPDGNNGMYGYAGTRTMDDNQYVLYFDPNRKAFILDKVDSTFHMNVTRTPTNDNPETLRQQFEQLDTSITATPEVRKPATAEAKDKDKSPAKPVSKATGPKRPSASSNKKARPPPPPKNITLALPTNDEDDDDDDDFGLTIEYPDEQKNKRADFSPAFAPNIQVRSFSDFLRDSEADDADGESDLEERDFANFNLPSPMNGQQRQQQQHHDQDEDAEGEVEQMDVDSEPDFEDALEDDLEAELEKELEAANSGDAEESEVSEED
ncbi:RNA polymerase II transcription elongation factor-domain-containing protein [Colletotrichum acutatum]|uniref:RNA polymerase II transcription elongation factor-domain-containing protein n=1 Tax=Glomerella acutata TaxID=27357 RepID=A0AAD8XQC4_GLOAC|nr:RNA polymerase II transcription elongation factor-domain-containing protein [Colletotrichum acutatum]KAK1731610.1 RNA polymerase II transcription elongation factor-domain-containing protein [Colletotrichum acutatum]